MVGPDPNDEGRDVPCDYELVGMVGAHDAQTPTTIEPCKDLLHCLFQILIAIFCVVFADQFSNNLGIHLTGEDVSMPLELLVKLAAVFDGAFVH